MGRAIKLGGLSLEQVIAKLAEEGREPGFPVRVPLKGMTVKALERRGHHVSKCADDFNGREHYVWDMGLAPACCVRPQRLTRNMLNPEAGEFLIDEDTPSCCDPGTETYHSM